MEPFDIIEYELLILPLVALALNIQDGNRCWRFFLKNTCNWFLDKGRTSIFEAQKIPSIWKEINKLTWIFTYKRNHICKIGWPLRATFMEEKI